MPDVHRSVHSASSWALRIAGLGLGGATALAVVPVLILTAPTALAGRRGRASRIVDGLFHRIAEWETRRVERCFSEPIPVASTARARRFVAARCPVGIVGGMLAALTGYGAVTVATGLRLWATGRAVDGIEPAPFNVVYLVALSAVLAFTAYFGLIAAANIEVRLARRLMGPAPGQDLRDRIDVLATSRADAVAVVDAERRRIERDLHDGVQQRLVALGMLIGRARRTPHRDDLLAEAHTTALAALDELRDVAWRVYPSALDREGLVGALAALAERAGLPTRTTVRLTTRPPPIVETAAYFAACEAVSNAVKHSEATAIELTAYVREGGLHVVVTDDGRGGADENGPGLTGIRRRAAAVDGTVVVTSPPGGGTRVEVEIPCG